MIDTLYRDNPSSLHRYDCRLKLFLLPLLLVLFFLPLGTAALCGYTLFFIVLTLFALGYREVLLPLKAIFPLLILIAILTPLFHRSGQPLVEIGIFAFMTDEGAAETLSYIARFSGISTLFFLFFRTTAMENILLGLSWYRLPYNATLVISIALRYIPHLAGLYGQIKAAHALRCGINDELPSRRIGSRLGQLFPVLVSLVIQSVKTIPTLTMALELKGIGRSNQRSRCRRLKTPDTIAVQIIFTLLLLVLIVSALVVFLIN